MAALSEIEKLEARFRENPEGRYFAPLADAYRKAGRVDDALMLVQAGLERHPDYLSAHIVLGRCHLDKKDDGAALAAFQQVLTIDAENIIALKSLAEISERIGNALDARRWLMRLLAVDSMNTEAEEDLHRLGGPVEEAAAAGAPAAEPLEEAPAGFSFADVVPPEAPTEPVPAIPEALVAAMPEPEIEPEPAPAMAESPALEMEAVHHEDAVSPAIEFLSATPGGLPLIMPEDVTPPEELTRPSAKMLQMVSPAAHGDGGRPLPQAGIQERGGRGVPAAARPASGRCRAACQAGPGGNPAEAERAGARRRVRRRVAAARGACVAERACAGGAAGATHRGPDTDGVGFQHSGARTGGGAPTAAAPAPAPAPPLTPKLGATFDEFFGGAPEGESVRPQPTESQAPSEDDPSAFNAWLHGLKR